MANLLVRETNLKFKVQHPLTCSVGLQDGLAALFFSTDYIVVRWQSGDIVYLGKTKQQLSEVVPWKGLNVAAFNLTKACIVLFDLEKAQTLKSIHIDFNQTECVNSLLGFGGTALGLVTRSDKESWLYYLNIDLKLVRKCEYPTSHIIDKLDEKTKVAVYGQIVKDAIAPIQIIHLDKQQSKNLVIQNIRYQDDLLLQRVWQLSESEILLGFNHKNKSFWETHNIQSNEKTMCIEFKHLIQCPLFVDITTNTFVFVGMKILVVDGKIKYTAYTTNIKTLTVSENRISYSGNFTVLDRRSILICQHQKDQIVLQSLRAISKDNYYMHLMHSIKALDKYGYNIGNICLSLLTGDQSE